MRIRNVLALFLALGVRSASAETMVGLDLAVVIADGEVVFADGFDDGVFGTPPWLGLGESPLNEAGTILDMPGDSVIVAPIVADPAELTLAWTLLELTSFSEGSLATMVLLGDDGGALYLGVVPGFAFLADATDGLIGLVPFPAAATVNLVLAVDDAGGAIALANDEVVFAGDAGFGGVVSGIGVVVVPEPSGMLIVGIGLVACASRRISRSRRWRRTRH